MRIAFPAGTELPPPGERRAILSTLAFLAEERERTRSRPARSAWKTAARHPELSYDELRLLDGR